MVDMVGRRRCKGIVLEYYLVDVTSFGKRRYPK
jgi:hypothetical protein